MVLHVHYKQTWSNMSNCDSQGNQHHQLKSYPKVRLLDVFTKIVELNIAECNEHQWTPNVCSTRTSGWTDIRRLCRSAFVKESQNVTEYHGHGISPNRSHSQSWTHTSLIIFSSRLCDREDPINLPYFLPGLSGGNPWAIKSDAVKHEKGNTTSLRFFECSVQKNLFRISGFKDTNLV